MLPDPPNRKKCYPISEQGLDKGWEAITGQFILKWEFSWDILFYISNCIEVLQDKLQTT